tara:strand:+ start:289 stop:597 length:309 start_codon:yes stop_codon:yes gene_type:complete
MDKELTKKIDQLLLVITSNTAQQNKEAEDTKEQLIDFSFRIAALEAASIEQQKDRETIKEAVNTLKTLATEGQTTLKVLIWVGTVIGSLITLVITFGGYLHR